ncbi:hypothetical protein ACFV4P_17490 [Kitasatospora sp. NPDC059795]|uniref:hypothetical protein n=1 Tax=Kitasatospora sp. NPDC059795 TaxID=3346949 RepID=UPI00365ED1FC
MTLPETPTTAPAACPVARSFDRMAKVFAEAPEGHQDADAESDIQALRDKHNAECVRGCAP